MYVIALSKGNIIIALQQKVYKQYKNNTNIDTIQGYKNRVIFTSFEYLMILFFRHKFHDLALDRNTKCLIYT